MANTSTLLSALLRTQPAMPRMCASRSTNQRKPTPCTRPRTTNRRASTGFSLMALFGHVVETLLATSCLHAHQLSLTKRDAASCVSTATLTSLYARERYAPSEVSTLIFSPSLMKGGTCTTSPVSVFAALVTLEAVALFSPG